MNRPSWVDYTTIGILTIFAILMWTLPAFSHEWFERRCCSGNDCQPAPNGAVQWTQHGWLVRAGLVNPIGTRLERDILVPFDDKRIRPFPPEAPIGDHATTFVCTGPNHVFCLYIGAGL